MLGLVVVVVLGAAVLGCGALAPRVKVAPPVLLLVVGVLLGFVPMLRQVHLPGEVVLLVFLPALLYWESLNTSLREIRHFLRVIIMISTLLVFITAAAVAAAAHGLGLPWGPAWVIGAALAPTDATAISVLARALPRRNLTVLRAESLVNDGTALVIYGLAVGVTAGEQHLGTLHVSGLLLLSYGAGIAAGIAIAWLSIRIRKLLDDPLQENVANLLTPFAAFLLAESLHASGVLAVVVCGLIMSQTAPRIAGPDARQLSIPFWTLSTYLLNGSLFVLIGLEVQSAVRGLTSTNLLRGLAAVAVISVVVIGVRFLWMFTTPYLIRAIDRRPQQREMRSPARARVLSAVSGFRGAVSLAAALAVPTVVASGDTFPDRDLIVFITTGVIVVTLAQALILPSVLRWARLPRDTGIADERHFAQLTAADEVIASLPRLAAELGSDEGVVNRVQHEYEKHRRVLVAGDATGDEIDPAVRHDQQYNALRLAGIRHKRATIVRLRDQQQIDDTVLRELQSRLDMEEVRLAPREVVE